MKSKLLSIALSTVAATLVLFNYPIRKSPHGSQQGLDRDGLSSFNQTKRDNLYDVQNSTLGFAEINMISLWTREDKQDSFAVQASFSGFDYHQVDGVDGSRVPTKALPYTMDQTDLTIGCWRAHMNILRSIVSRRVATALIFEDDADWDVALKAQLVQFARGSRWLTNTSEDIVPHSPYGDDWDILWIGHGAVRDGSPFVSKQQDGRRWVIPKDPTVLPPEERTEVYKPDMSHWEDGPDGDKSTRIVLVPSWSINTAAYAISYRGAQKLLYHLSMLPFNEAVDQGMGFMCEYKVADLKCIAPFPALIGVSKPPGGVERWSDIQPIEGWQKGAVYDKGQSLRTMFSVRQNVDRLLRGEKVFKSYTGTEMHIDDIGAAVGHAEVLNVFPKMKAPVEHRPAGPIEVVDMTPKNIDE